MPTLAPTAHAPPKSDRAAGIADRPAKHDARASSGASAGLPLFLQATRTTGIQAKLVVNEPGDAFEQEADAVAQRAAGSQPVAWSGTRGHLIPARDAPVFHDAGEEEAVQRTCAACASGVPCPACAGDDEIRMQQEPAGPPARSASWAAPAQLRPPDAGSPLSPAVRHRAEPLLGADLDAVRVHSSPAAQETAAALRAKAFTHANHIWLGPHQSADDVSLLSHEATHVVQQAGGARTATVQRRESGGDIDAAAKAALARATEGAETSEDDTDTENREKAREAIRDPARRSEKKGEAGEAVEPAVAPRIEQTRESRTQAEETAAQTHAEVEKPPKPEETGEAKAASGAEAEDGQRGAGEGKAAGPKAGAAAIAREAFAAAAAVETPEPPIDVVPPAPVLAVDAAGEALTPHPEADAFAAGLAEGARHLRQQGSRLRKEARRSQSNAGILRGNIRVGLAGVTESESSVRQSEAQQTFRHEAHAQAQQVLEVSRGKAEMVAGEAPGHLERATEQR